MREKRINEIKGVIFIALGLIVLASLVSFSWDDLSFFSLYPNRPLHNWIKNLGSIIGASLFFVFGWSAYLVCFFLFWLAYRFFINQPYELRFIKIVGLFLMLVSLSSLLSLTGNQGSTFRFSRAGILGMVLADSGNNYLGKLGSYIVFITFFILALSLATGELISTFILGFFDKIYILLKKFLSFLPLRKRLTMGAFPSEKKKIPPQITLESTSIKTTPIQQKPQVTKVNILEVKPQEPKLEIKEKVPKIKPTKKEISGYKLPPLDLLDSPPPISERQIKEDLVGNARILEEMLADFGISAKVTNIERGPVITRYELEPAAGVKLQKIVSLSDDIALTMKAQSVRVVAPIPGKGRVGVEVPNTQTSLVYLKEVLASKEYQSSSSLLTLALGKDIAGKPVVADLVEMPHLLIAGTTGSGKTVCVNCLVLSILFRATPQEVKFLMVDPKMVELAPFNGLAHLLCPVVTEVKKVGMALNWVINEMEERYKLFANLGVRNIEAYNQRQERLPYIVVIIDELADLMVVARDQIESAITRLAQLSRAVGIHLILATQRPSVDVVTGVIKANFPARISFRVASKVDSRTVLDMNGADKLLGKGDLLFLKPGESRPIRAQGSLVSDKEIERVVEFIRKQAEPVYEEEIFQEHKGVSWLLDEKDELYDEAVRLVMETGQASTSILQRRLRLGYTRAARIIDMMEREGLVGPYEGTKPRKILVDRQAYLKERIIKDGAK